MRGGTEPLYRKISCIVLQFSNLTSFRLYVSRCKSRSIFVNSMSALFHAAVPDDFVQQVFDVMERAHWHRYQVLTKRPERVAALNEELPWPAQVWLDGRTWDEMPTIATPPPGVS